MPRPDDDDRLDVPPGLWPAPEPRPDFVDRVVARIDRAPERPPAPRRAWIAGLAIAAAAAAAIALVVFRGGDGGRAPAHGSFSATAPTTVPLGGRGVVVAYPGTVVAWSVDAGGAAEVHMSAGDAFFRVDPGGPFVVHTPAGEVRVTGTCFTVVVDGGRTSVDVHEGTVELGDGGLVLGAGERGHLGGDAPARRRPAPRAAIAPAPRTEPAPAAARESRGDDCFCFSDPRHLEADQALLDEWAGMCRVRADVPPFVDGDDASAVDAAADQLGLTGDERRAFHDAARELTDDAVVQIREIYVAATGDAEAAARIDLDSMFEQIDATRALGEDARLRATLSQERAGHAEPPADATRMTPYEELYRRLIAAGEDFEARLAARVGAARARELRLRFGGWPGPDFQWFGCP